MAPRPHRRRHAARRRDQFDGLTPDSEARIRDFCAHREPLYHDVDE
jgi:hypothetical protein